MNLSPAVLKAICAPETLDPEVVKLLEADHLLSKEVDALYAKRRELGDRCLGLMSQSKLVNVHAGIRHNEEIRTTGREAHGRT